MHRREFLVGVGGVTTLGVAGCLDGTTDADPTGGDPADGDPTLTATDGPGTPTETATPPGTPPHDAAFPPGRDDVDRVVWYREVSDPDGTLHLSYSTSSVTVPGEVSFTLHNNADRRFETNFYDWTLYRWEGGRWRHVAPLLVNQPLMDLEPGESHTWTVTFSDENPERVQFRASGTDAVTVEPVGGGHYAFAVDGWWDTQSETPAHDHETVCAARFAVEGRQLPLVASEAVTATRREGDAVVVEADNPTTEGGDPAAYVLTRDDGASDPQELITEQVYRRWPLRDALAHADDADQVRVETRTGTTPLFGVHEDEDPAVTYDGATFRIGAERREG